MILCDYLSRIAVDQGDPSEVILISFNAIAQYRLALDYTVETFLVATRNATSSGDQKGLDPSLKPENQSKSKKVLLKPSVGAPSPSPRSGPISLA